MKLIPGLDNPSLFATKEGKIVLANGVERNENMTGRGYSIVYWEGKNYYVHRLVAAAYLGLDLADVSRQVNHKDFDKQNNSVSNLEIVTHQENIGHFLQSYRERNYPHDNESQLQCRKCGEVKPHDEFNNNSATRFGKASYCKACYRKYYNAARRKTKNYE